MAMAIVITTIQFPTKGVCMIADQAEEHGHNVIVIGDRKSPGTWEYPGVDFWSITRQATHGSATATALPTDTYARKMLGYLVAAERGHSWIRETDDDNRPYTAFLDSVPPTTHAREVTAQDRWVNIYSFFTDRFVWPRGLPLNQVRASHEALDAGELTAVAQPFVMQAIADGDPDVDAVYRLTAPDASDIRFADAPPLVMAPGTWTPFNSQATTWPVVLLPLMYLPTTCSFRMTDIWRSFIAQRLMSAMGIRLVITGATVFQERNAHDLTRDFRDEVEGYVGYDRFIDVLEVTPITGTAATMLDDLHRVYSACVKAGFFMESEFPVLEAWLSDMRTLGYGV